jgi:hypothetical protein
MVRSLPKPRLLLACAWALLTCACPGPDSLSLEAFTPKSTLTLDAAQPHAERLLHLRTEVAPGKKVTFSEPRFSVDSSVRWDSRQAERSDVVPWYRVRLVDPRDGRVYDERVLVLAPLSSYGYIGLGASLPLEGPTRDMDVSVRLEFDRQGPPSEGTLSVEWMFYGAVSTDASSREGLQLTLSET